MSTPLRMGMVVRCGRSFTVNETASLNTSRLTWNFTMVPSGELGANRVMKPPFRVTRSWSASRRGCGRRRNHLSRSSSSPLWELWMDRDTLGPRWELQRCKLLAVCALRRETCHSCHARMTRSHGSFRRVSPGSPRVSTVTHSSVHSVDAGHIAAFRGR